MNEPRRRGTMKAVVTSSRAAASPIGRRWWAALALGVALVAARAGAFNVDIPSALTHRGPSGSYFGFSVDVHMDRGLNWSVFFSIFCPFFWFFCRVYRPFACSGASTWKQRSVLLAPPQIESTAVFVSFFFVVNVYLPDRYPLWCPVRCPKLFGFFLYFFI